MWVRDHTLVDLVIREWILVLCQTWVVFRIKIDLYWFYTHQLDSSLRGSQNVISDQVLWKGVLYYAKRTENEPD